MLVSLQCETQFISLGSHAVGSDVVSEHIDTLSVNNVCPWMGRNAKNFEQCGADDMLLQLLEMCTDLSQFLPSSQKSTLFDTSLEAVMHLCNGPGVAQKIKQHLIEFCNVEGASDSGFFQAANTALVELRKVNVPGIPAFKDDEETNILFRENDSARISQIHQGKKSTNKPDIIVVSYKSAMNITPEGRSKSRVCQSACKQPTGDQDNLQWIEVRTTFEFKRPKTRLPHPPSAYNKHYVVLTLLCTEYIKETDTSAQPTNSTPATDLAQTSYKTSSELQNIYERLRSDKRGPGHLCPNEPPPSKRPKQDEETRSKQETKKKKLHPVAQNGLYVAEMFAAHITRQYVISFIVNNDIIYLWWFDRQHTIQCAGINFVQDLPRFVVLLFIMQRMGYKQWDLHPLFKPEHGYKGEIIVEHEEDNDNEGKDIDTQGQDKKMFMKKPVDLALDFSSDEHTTNFGLLGHAATVLPVKSKALSALPRQFHFINQSTELVVKLFWPEEACQSKPEILEQVSKIANEDPDVLGHVPRMVWFHKFEGASTAIVRKALEINQTGSRVIQIIVFRELISITTLSGPEFLLAWWDIVKCHRALWKRGVHHRDVSPNSLTGYRLVDGRFMGVLNDFDLSSTKIFMPSIQDALEGFESTGTIPFMSLHLLLPKAIAGQVEHKYHHYAESFIWVLTWVCFRYEEGKLLRKNRPLDEWLTPNPKNVFGENMSFFGRLRSMHPTPSHQMNFNVAMQCLAVVHEYLWPFTSVPVDDEKVFLIWLQNHMPEDVLNGDILSDM